MSRQITIKWPHGAMQQYGDPTVWHLFVLCAKYKTGPCEMEYQNTTFRSHFSWRYRALNRTSPLPATVMQSLVVAYVRWRRCAALRALPNANRVRLADWQPVAIGTHKERVAAEQPVVVDVVAREQLSSNPRGYTVCASLSFAFFRARNRTTSRPCRHQSVA